jgi:hypothetical protein
MAMLQVVYRRLLWPRLQQSWHVDIQCCQATCCRADDQQDLAHQLALKSAYQALEQRSRNQKYSQAVHNLLASGGALSSGSPSIRSSMIDATLNGSTHTTTAHESDQHDSDAAYDAASLQGW